MQPDLLAQLKDVHLPLAPGWWPPAPGWWLLALLLLVLLVLLVRRVQRAYRRRRPFVQARRLYAQLHTAYQQGQLSPEQYLHQSNELLKRLLIFGAGDNAARSANDEDWLELLDQFSDSKAFTRGPGRQLGNQRFAAHPQSDIDALHPLLERFFNRARP